LDKEATFLAGCTVRGWFATSKAKKYGRMIEKDLAEKGITAIASPLRVGLRECMLSVVVTCDESSKRQVQHALDLLGFNFQDLKLPQRSREVTDCVANARFGEVTAAFNLLSSRIV
jgi:hypothetical protein